MSYLIDNFRDNLRFIGGKWYFARPLDLVPPVHRRFGDAWKVLIGRCVAVHFKEDERYDDKKKKG